MKNITNMSEKEFKNFEQNKGKMRNIKNRLEYLRGELRRGQISYAELCELQSLIPYIEESDVELLEAAGVPEKFDLD